MNTSMATVTFRSRHNAKPVKRLQTSLPLDKTTKFDDNQHRLYKSDSSLLSTTSVSPPPMSMNLIDSTTSTYLEHEGHNEPIVSPQKYDPMNFSSVYHTSFPSNAFYNNYTNDRTSMMYNPAYGYMGSSTVGPMMPSASSPIPMVPYGCYSTSVYPTNNYHTSFF
jgi:hypothetical protein